MQGDKVVGFDIPRRHSDFEQYRSSFIQYPEHAILIEGDSSWFAASDSAVVDHQSRLVDRVRLKQPDVPPVKVDLSVRIGQEEIGRLNA
jgi:hypothetical protein